MPILFASPRYTIRDLQADELPALQALFEANTGYFQLVGGQPPRPDEAALEFTEQPPAHLGFATRWFAGVFDRAARLRGLVILVSDLSARGVWHTALFFLEDALHGSGAAAELQQALEDFAVASGARWLRLGVIEGNRRAERFWARCGFREVRTRPLVDASGQQRTTRVMVKPLTAASIDKYLRLVPRDEPGSDLP